jgi:hypothetical protein
MAASITMPIKISSLLTRRSISLMLVIFHFLSCTSRMPKRHTLQVQLFSVGYEYGPALDIHEMSN